MLVPLLHYRLINPMQSYDYLPTCYTQYPLMSTCMMLLYVWVHACVQDLAPVGPSVNMSMALCLCPYAVNPLGMGMALCLPCPLLPAHHHLDPSGRSSAKCCSVLHQPHLGLAPSTLQGLQPACPRTALATCSQRPISHACPASTAPGSSSSSRPAPACVWLPPLTA